MLTTADNSEIALNRADRTATYLRENANLLGRYGINVDGSIARINRVAASGVPAYAALDPILNLGSRVNRIADRLLGIRVARGGRDIAVDSRYCPDGDALLEIATNLSTFIPSDGNLCRSYS